MAKVILRVELDEKLVASYERKAKKAGIQIEDLLSDRLEKAAKHDSDKPLYVTDEHRRALEGYLAKNLSNPTQLVMAVEALTRVKIDKETNINLPPPLLKRVKSRCFGRKYSDVLSEQIRQGLEQFAGMR